MRFVAAILFSAAVCAHSAPLRDMGLEMNLTFGDQPLHLGSMAYQDAGGKSISVTRADFLMSGFALKKQDGSWMETEGWFACIKPGEGKVRAVLTKVPEDTYTGVRFFIGVDPVTDAADPNSFPPGSPLHPQVNGLHWGWQSGFVYLALEGLWQKSPGETSGYSYHLAGKDARVAVELPVELYSAKCGTLQLTFDLKPLLGSTDIAAFGDSTHSRNEDPRAITLRDKATKAFSVGGQLPDMFQKPLMFASFQPKSETFGTLLPLPISSRLPQVQMLPDNLPTREGVALGQRLFHETKLSKNNQFSCASCHDRSAAFTDKGKKFSVGIDGVAGKRNSMPLFNLLWQSEFFWDGRAPTIREQVLEPIQDVHEMNESLENVVNKLKASPEYVNHFQLAFGTREITPNLLGLAIEQFLSTLISQNSKFDKAARKELALTEQELRGQQLFLTEYDPKRQLFGADCFHCHGGNLFTNNGFLNNGLDADPLEPGRAAVTKLPADQGKFRVPSLRNIAVTAPYMHDGRFQTLDEVVDHYDHGIKRSATLDPNLAKHPVDGLKLSGDDKKAIVAFLKTLTDEDFLNGE